VIIEVSVHTIAISGMPLVIGIMESKNQCQTAVIHLALKTSNTQITIVEVSLGLSKECWDHTFRKNAVVNMTMSLAHAVLVPVLVFRIKLSPRQIPVASLNDHEKHVLGRLDYRGPPGVVAPAVIRLGNSDLKRHRTGVKSSICDLVQSVTRGVTRVKSCIPMVWETYENLRLLESSDLSSCLHEQIASNRHFANLKPGSED